MVGLTGFSLGVCGTLLRKFDHLLFDRWINHFCRQIDHSFLALMALFRLLNLLQPRGGRRTHPNQLLVLLLRFDPGLLLFDLFQ